MKALVITVVDAAILGRDLWEKVKLSFNVNDDSLYHIANIATDKVVIVIKETEKIQKTLEDGLRQVHYAEFCLVSHQELNNVDYKYKHIDNNEPYKLIRLLIESLKDLKEAQTYFEQLWEFIKKTAAEQLKAYIIHSFLPLDIDMQAFANPKNKDKNGYLEEIYKDNDKLYKRDHYIQKLYDLWYCIGEKPPKSGEWKRSDKADKGFKINKPNPNLLKVAGLDNGKPKESQIFKFLKALDDKNIVLFETFDVDFTFNVNGLEKKKIESFHDWFIALDTVLRENV